MPWCDDCSRFFNPPSLGEGGECPVCGRSIGARTPVPWHFKLLVGMAGTYLVWRGVQGLAWVVDRLV